MACQVISIVDIIIIYHNARKQYRYRGSVQIPESNMILENDSGKGFKLFTTIEKRIVKPLSR